MGDRKSEGAAVVRYWLRFWWAGRVVKHYYAFSIQPHDPQNVRGEEDARTSRIATIVGIPQGEGWETERVRVWWW